eukprot:m.31989 g.31989  ORF g.31989 m.31989 type:complete len:216 (+) comp8369_c0_seq1:290-937(+)
MGFRESFFNRDLPLGGKVAFTFLFLAMAALTVMGIVRISVYFNERECAYFNPEYKEDDNIELVQHHVLAGTLTCLVAIPILMLVEIFEAPKAARIAAFLIMCVGLLATVATVVPMSGFIKIRQLAGLGPVLIALVWTVGWVASVIITSVCACMNFKNGMAYKKWVFISSAWGFFGFLLLPVFYVLKDHEVANTILLLILLVSLLSTGHMALWRMQ